MKPMKTTLSALATIAIAGPAFAGDFAALDTNTDGQVSFDEYKAIALTEGKTVTLAAQEFTRMAQGDAIITQDEFFLAAALADQPYALQPGLVSAPVNVETVPSDYEPMEFVETFETSADTRERIEPPITNKDVTDVEAIKDAPVTVETPLDVDPVVAGDIETSAPPTDDLIDMKETTPVEEFETDFSKPNLEITPEVLEDDLGSEDDQIIETPDAEDETPAELADPLPDM